MTINYKEIERLPVLVKGRPVMGYMENVEGLEMTVGYCGMSILSEKVPVDDCIIFGIGQNIGDLKKGFFHKETNFPVIREFPENVIF